MRPVLIIALLFSPVCLFAQNIINVGAIDPISFLSPMQKHIPVTAANAYTRTAGIYFSYELGGPGVISFISFFIDSLMAKPSYNLPVKIYLKETSDDSLSPLPFDSALNNAALVFDGIIDSSYYLTKRSWLNVSFQNNFQYSGVSNLIVYIECNAGPIANGDSSSISFRYYGSMYSVGHQWSNDSIPPPDPGNALFWRPLISFYISPTDSCSIPTSHLGNAFYYETNITDTVMVYADKHVNVNNSTYDWYSLSTVNTWFATTTEPYVYFYMPLFAFTFHYSQTCAAITNLELYEMEIWNVSINYALNELIIDSEIPYAGDTRIRLHNMNGALLIDQKCSNVPCSLDINTFKNGIYILTVESEYFVRKYKVLFQNN